jgi:hypothetical protein
MSNKPKNRPNSHITPKRKKSMKKSVSGLIGGAVMALLIQNHASADDTTRLQVDYNIGDYHGYNASDYIVDLHGPYHCSYNEETYATAFDVNYVSGQPLPDGNNSSFVSFCMYVKADLVPTGYWKAMACSDVDTSQLGYSFGISSLNRAANLYNAYVNTVNFGSQSGEINGGALQLAIWDVLNGNNVTSISDRSSLFYVTKVGRESAAVIAQANAFLDSSANNPNSIYQATFWEVTDAHGNPFPTSNQDLIGPDSMDLSLSFVPEPGTYVAAGIAGLYVIIAGFRRLAARKQRA